MFYYSYSLDGQDGRRPAYFDVADAVEATRTVRESAERAAAAVATTSTTSFTAAALTGNGSNSALTASANAGRCMYRPETHRVATDQHRSTSDDNKTRTPELENKPEAEIDRLSSDGADNRCVECADDAFRGASATLADFTDKDDRCQSRSEITSPTTQPEAVTVRHVAALNRKSTCQEPRSERFDRVVQYFDSRQRISGKTGHRRQNTLLDIYIAQRLPAR